MVNKYVYVIISIATFFGGIEIGYIAFLNVDKPVMLLDADIQSELLQDPSFRLMIIKQIMQEPAYRAEIISNPQSQSMIASMQLMEIGGRLDLPQYPIPESGDIHSTLRNIENLLEMISTTYREGGERTAYSLANVAFIDNYENIEKDIALHDDNLAKRINLLLREDLRNAIKNGDSAETIDKEISIIKEEINKVKLLLT